MEGSKGAGHCFFSLTDGSYSKFQTHTLGLCVLKNWDKLDPQSLKKTHLTFFCKSAWPQYPLEGGRQWLVEGSLNYNTVLQLDQFCIRQQKWVEVPYVLFFSFCKI